MTPRGAVLSRVPSRISRAVERRRSGRRRPEREIVDERFLSILFKCRDWDRSTSQGIYGGLLLFFSATGPATATNHGVGIPGPREKSLLSREIEKPVE
jgi:hypothetical protein